MRIDISGLKIDVGEALSDHIRARMEGEVAKYFDRAIEGGVVVSRQGHNFQVDASVHAAPGIVMRAAAAAGEPYAAADQAIDRIAKRLRRYKRRLRDHHKVDDAAEHIMAQHYVVAVEPEDHDDDFEEPTGNNPVIIAEEPARILTMTPSAAVMALDLSDQPAYVFFNAANGALNVVYRRGDGNVGWIDPNGLDVSSPDKR